VEVLRFGKLQPVPACVATIGVHDWDLDCFLTALRGLERPFVVDVRQRRGVRGPQYSWANSQRLQRALGAAGIGYRHVRDLAPTTELRQLQYAADDAAGVGKRSRQRLDPSYVAGYTEQILSPFNLPELLASLPDDVTPVLLCVEAEPTACHRSLIAGRLASEHGLDMVHLRP
jgi:uncharacterized protein (DUF488 family)